MSWNEAWGTYAKSGAPYDVAMVGGNGTVLGFPTSRAISDANHGRGIQFTALNDEGTSVKIDLSLIGISTSGGRWVGNNSTGYSSPGGGITNPGYDYGWFVEIWYSTDGGHTYVDLLRNVKVATHNTPMALAYNDRTDIQSWKLANIEYTKVLTLPPNFTHLKFEVRGDDPAERHQNIYSREIVLPKLTTRWIERATSRELAPSVTDTSYKSPKSFDNYELIDTITQDKVRTYYYGLGNIKPWAIRKNGVFKSHNKHNGFMRIRKSGSYVDKLSLIHI